MNPASTDDRGRYGRLLRYVRTAGGTLGSPRSARATRTHGRGRDGYDWHPMQSTYRRADANTRNLWVIR